MKTQIDIEFEIEYEDGFVEYESYKIMIPESPLNSPKKINEKIVIPKQKEKKLIYQHEAFQKFYEQEKNLIFSIKIII
jgi:hypothetical protein